MYQPNPPYLSDIPAVSLVENPSAAIIAVGDVVADNILGLEELFGPLSGHLADYHWPLKVNLWKRLMMNNRHTHTHKHMYLNPAGVLICAPCIVLTLIVQSGKVGLPVSFKYGFIVLNTLSVFRDDVTQRRFYFKHGVMDSWGFVYLSSSLL